MQAALRLNAPNDPLANLREALAPLHEATPGTPPGAAQKAGRRTRKPTPPAPETYLGALL